jgi:hypothetical protein
MFLLCAKFVVTVLFTLQYLFLILWQNMGAEIKEQKYFCTVIDQEQWLEVTSALNRTSMQTGLLT